MLNFIICDDEAACVSSIQKSLEKIINRRELKANIGMATTNPQKVLEHLYNGEHAINAINVYILDIDLKSSITGLELARRIRREDSLAYIIFITGHLEFAMLSYKYKIKAFEYLTKPVAYEEFLACIDELYQDYNMMVDTIDKRDKSYVSIKVGYKTYTIRVNEIIMLESRGAKVVIYTETTTLETYATMASLLDELNKAKNCFYRVHKTFVINLNHVVEINYSGLEAEMSNGLFCNIARTKKNELREKYNLIRKSIQFASGK